MSEVRHAKNWTKKGMAEHGIAKPHNIPLTIKHVYPEQWEGMKRFLGTNTVPFTKFKEFFIEHNFKSGLEYRRYLKESPVKGYPRYPAYNYGKQWKGWMHFKRSLHE